MIFREQSNAEPRENFHKQTGYKVVEGRIPKDLAVLFSRRDLDYSVKIGFRHQVYDRLFVYLSTDNGDVLYTWEQLKRFEEDLSSQHDLVANLRRVFEHIQHIREQEAVGMRVFYARSGYHVDH